MGSEFAEPEKRPEQKQSVPTNRQSFSSSQSTHKIQPVRPVQKHTPPEERQKIMDELAQRVTDWRKPTRMRDLFDAPSTQQPSPIAPEHESSLPTAMPSVKPEPTIVATTNLTPGMLQQSTQETKSAANAPLASRSAPSDPKQLIAQAKPESEDAWLNTGIASKGGPERMPFDGRIVRTDRNGKQTIIPVKYGQIVQQQAGDQLQYSFGKVPQNQSPSQKQRDEAIKKMPYPDKLSTAMKLVPGMLEGDAKKLFEQLTTDPKFVAALAAGGAAFGALQFTPAGPAIDAAFMVAFGLKAGFELGKFFYDAFQAKDEAGIKAAAESLKSAIEDGGPVLISGLAGGLKAATGLLTKLKGGKQAGQTAQALSQLKPQQITQFEQAIALRNAGKGMEAEVILNQLRTALGKENFEEIEKSIVARLAENRKNSKTTKLSSQDGKKLYTPGTAQQLLNSKDHVVLELFGGKNGKVPGAINVDIAAETGIKADLMKDKLSFVPKNSVDEILTFNPYIPKEAGGTGIMDYLPEAAQVLKPGGRLVISGTNNNKFAQLKGSIDLQKINLRIVEQKIPLPDEFKDLTFHRIDGSELPTDKMVTTILEKIK